jgi:nucleoside-triphosphatase THEP1
MSHRVFSQTTSIWSRAAALGSLWAAFEIVVGSFLHNLRVPFAGVMLAAASVLLLTAAVQVWVERGLIWRAALVCAMMKSVSPSAVLLGPMVGILAEGVILQLSLRLLGRGWFGCAVGGALAVGYTLLQKIVSLTIVYGADLVRVFSGIVQFASKVTGWEGLQPGTVLLVLALTQSILGVAAGLTGWHVGRSVLRTTDAALPSVQVSAEPTGVRGTGLQHSLLLLMGLLLLLPLGMWLIGTAPPVVSALLVMLAAVGVAWRYGRLSRRLMNPRLWIEVVFIASLSGLVLGAVHDRATEGLLAGARMALRAVWMVCLFSAIGVEFTHPRLLRLFSRGRLATVYAATQSAWRALPDFLANIPDFKSVLRHPVRTLAQLFQRVDSWYRHLATPRVVILTGERGAGKSSLCLALAERARQAGMTVGGIVCLGDGTGERREGYRVKNLLTGEVRPLARRSDAEEGIRCGSYLFDPEGIQFGRRALEQAIESGVPLLIVDEVGPLELNGEGWAPVLERLPTNGTCLWVVRPSLIPAIQQRYPRFAEATVLDATATDVETLVRLVL